MSNYDINSNPALVKRMVENAKKSDEEYLKAHPDSLIPAFENELRELGFEFQITNQINGFLPKHKKIILPLAMKYYQQAEVEEKAFFMSFFHYKGFEEAIPLLLNDYYTDNSHINRWAIGDRLYQISSKKYIDDYLKIVVN